MNATKPPAFLFQRRTSGLLLLAGLALSSGLQAQTSGADAATRELLRQQEREQALRRQQESMPDVHLPAPEETLPALIPSDESPCFTIRQIDLVDLPGEHLAHRFSWAIAAANLTSEQTADVPLNRCLGSTGINLVMRRIQNAIIKRGFITTRVLAEPQDLTSGILRLTLVPGRVRDIRLAPGTNERVTLRNALPVRPGDLLNLRDIEQALENLKRVPTADADIQVEPAASAEGKPGESDLVVSWRQAFPFRLTLSLDDSGTKATGRYMSGVTVSYDDALTLNDLLYVSANRAVGGGYEGNRGTESYTLHYSLPIDYWQLGFTTSSIRYHQAVAGVNQTYIYSGESENHEIKLSRLVYRDAVRKTTVALRGWARSSQNYIDDTEIVVQRRRMAGWGFETTHREFIGDNTLDASLDYRHGTGAFQALPAPEEAFNDGTSRPRIFSSNVQFTAPFTVAKQAMRYIGAWRAQWSETPLVAQDRFAMAGRYTVRGFDGENVLSADRGWLWRNDLGWTPMAGGPEIYLGIDYAELSGQHSAQLAGTRLAGAAIGLRGAIKTLSYDFFVGQPLLKPDAFRTGDTAAGFNLNWTF